jgi:hypothetical protein
MLVLMVVSALLLVVSGFSGADADRPAHQPFPVSSDFCTSLIVPGLYRQGQRSAASVKGIN